MQTRIQNRVGPEVPTSSKLRGMGVRGTECHADSVVSFEGPLATLHGRGTRRLQVMPDRHELLYQYAGLRFVLWQQT